VGISDLLDISQSFVEFLLEPYYDLAFAFNLSDVFHTLGPIVVIEQRLDSLCMLN